MRSVTRTWRSDRVCVCARGLLRGLAVLILSFLSKEDNREGDRDREGDTRAAVVGVGVCVNGVCGVRAERGDGEATRTVRPTSLCSGCPALSSLSFSIKRDGNAGKRAMCMLASRSRSRSFSVCVCMCVCVGVNRELVDELGESIE